MPNTLFLPPKLHRTSHEEERKVTWIELFYDLVYVATLIQLGNLLSEDVNLTGLLQFALVFAVIWWSWTGITFYMNRFVGDDIWHRLLIFVQIAAIFCLGISLEGAFDSLIFQFIIAYAVVRFIQVILYVRTWRFEPASRPLTQRYVYSFLTGIIIWLISGFVPMPYAAILWFLAIMIEVTTSLSPRTQALVTLLPPNIPHMRERYGIFVIIVLGESFIKTLTNGSGTLITGEVLVFILMSFFVVFGMWWLYFNDVEGSKFGQRTIAPFVWVYAHLPLTMSITAFGVAFYKLFMGIEEGYLKHNYFILFCTAILFYGLAMVLIEAALVRRDKKKSERTRILAKSTLPIVMILIMIFGRGLNSTVLMGITAILFVMVILVDEYPNLRSLWVSSPPSAS